MKQYKNGRICESRKAEKSPQKNKDDSKKVFSDLTQRCRWMTGGMWASSPSDCRCCCWCRPGRRRRSWASSGPPWPAPAGSRARAPHTWWLRPPGSLREGVIEYKPRGGGTLFWRQIEKCYNFLLNGINKFCFIYVGLCCFYVRFKNVPIFFFFKIFLIFFYPKYLKDLKRYALLCQKYTHYCAI